jgi:aldose 1-epimerase
MKNLITILAVVAMIACTSQKKPEEKSLFLDASAFDTTIDGMEIHLYTLKNDSGITVYLTNYGARVVGILTPDKNGKFADIVPGYRNIGSYLKDKIYAGPIVGRYANRIGNARFILDNQEYNLYRNEGKNTLHGGKKGLDKQIWKATQNNNSVTMTYLSPDGEEGYPGNLNIRMTYTLNPDNSLKIEYEAETDQPTVINLTNHTYWNLRGEGDSTILDHYCQINADYYTPIDNEWIPTGEIAPVSGTPFDFREGKQIGRDINADNEQLKNGLGYDHNWVLNKDSAGVFSSAAKLWEKTTGRYVKVSTTEPGLQFYSGNFMDGTIIGKSGRPYMYRSACIFEAQHFPDSPNHNNFPSTVLRPGEKYTQLTLYEFGVE